MNGPGGAVDEPRRWRAADVRHLSLIGFPCGDTTLFRTVGQPALLGAPPDRVAACVRQGLTALAAAARPRFLYVGGGLTELPEVRSCDPRLPPGTSLVWSAEGRFVGERGGQQVGGPSAVVVDVGQTAIKVSGNGPRRIHERPPRQVPPGQLDADGIEHIRRVLAAELATTPSWAPVVVAVPGEVGDDLTLGHSSYGWSGRAGLLGQLLPPGAATTRPVWILNDVELAAESARAEIAPAPGQACLVVTLGFAPGGAFLVPGWRAPAFKTRLP